jgi:hypothetical protein
MSANAKTASFKLQDYGIKNPEATALLSQPPGAQTAPLDSLKLAPYGVFIGRVK